MKTNTAPVAAAPASAVEPALNLFTFTAEGECVNPESFVVKVPKGASCEILLACDPDSAQWSWGFACSFGQEDMLSTPPSRLVGSKHETRQAALLEGLRSAAGWFAASPKNKLARKCSGEVEAVLIALGSSPANKPAASLNSAIPEPQNLDVDVARLEPNPSNPRGAVKAEDVAELAQAIATVGLLQPIGVRIIPGAQGLPGLHAENRLELLWGHRRLAAVQSLGREKIPARVYEGITDDQARLLLLIENGQRKDLDPIQEARGYAEMMRDFELTQDDISKHVKKSRPVIANALRLLELPSGVQELLTAGQLSTAHGTALCRFKEWPAVCAKIAEIAVKDKASANSLEKHLPFADDLVDAKLVVDLCSWSAEARLDFEAVKKLAKSERSIFAWEDKQRYEDFAFCLDLALAARLIAEQKKKNEERSKTIEERNSSQQRTETGELTPEAKRARQSKLDGNLKNRLESCALEHAALTRLRVPAGIDHQSLLIVCGEAFKHSGVADVEELAERLGIKLPKDFDEHVGYYDEEGGGSFDCLAKLDPVDLLRLSTAALISRDASHAMRNASQMPAYVEMGARGNVSEAVDAESYVAEWHEKIFALVARGAKAEDVMTQLACPEFIAEQMVRQCRRELRDAGITPLSKEDNAILAKIGVKGVAVMRSEFSIMWDKTNSELAKIFAETSAADVAAVRRLDELEKALAKLTAPAAEEKKEEPKAGKPKKATKKAASAKKPAKKAAPAKKGGKKK